MNKDNTIFITIIAVIASVVFVGGIFYIATNHDVDYFNEENKKLFSELEYKVPKGFEERKYSSVRFIDYDENSMYFDLEISSNEKKYGNMEKKLQDEVYIKLGDKVGEVEEQKINGYKMISVKIESKDIVKYYYAMESTNYVYLFEFKISDYKNGDREDEDTNRCLTAREEILSSIKLK